MHCNRWKRHGDPLFRKKAGNGEVKNKPCCVPSCGEKGQATFNDSIYCNIHIYRVKTHGDPHKVKKLGNGKSTPEREKARAAERQRRYLATPHGKLRSRFNTAKMRAMKYGCDWFTGITKDVFLALHSQTHCAICGEPFNNENEKTIDHKVPLSRGGANHPDNLQMAHGSCNSKKHNRHD